MFLTSCYFNNCWFYYKMKSMGQDEISVSWNKLNFLRLSENNIWRFGVNHWNKSFMSGICGSLTTFFGFCNIKHWSFLTKMWCIFEGNFVWKWRKVQGKVCIRCFLDHLPIINTMNKIVFSIHNCHVLFLIFEYKIDRTGVKQKMIVNYFWTHILFKEKVARLYFRIEINYTTFLICHNYHFFLNTAFCRKDHFPISLNTSDSLSTFLFQLRMNVQKILCLLW